MATPRLSTDLTHLRNLGLTEARGNKEVIDEGFWGRGRRIVVPSSTTPTRTETLLTNRTRIDWDITTDQETEGDSPDVTSRTPF